MNDGYATTRRRLDGVFETRALLQHPSQFLPFLLGILPGRCLTVRFRWYAPCDLASSERGLRGQRRTRHDHDERFAQLTQACEDSGKPTEGRVGHHALAEVVREEVDVLVDGIDPAGLCRPLQLYSNAACPKTFVRILCD